MKKRYCKKCDSVYSVNIHMIRYDYWLCPACELALDIDSIAIGQSARESILFRKF
jgi:hypothetical protein